MQNRSRRLSPAQRVRLVALWQTVTRSRPRVRVTARTRSGRLVRVTLTYPWGSGGHRGRYRYVGEGMNAPWAATLLTTVEVLMLTTASNTAAEFQRILEVVEKFLTTGRISTSDLADIASRIEGQAVVYLAQVAR